MTLLRRASKSPRSQIESILPNIGSSLCFPNQTLWPNLRYEIATYFCIHKWKGPTGPVGKGCSYLRSSSLFHFLITVYAEWSFYLTIQQIEMNSVSSRPPVIISEAEEYKWSRESSLVTNYIMAMPPDMSQSHLRGNWQKGFRLSNLWAGEVNGISSSLQVVLLKWRNRDDRLIPAPEMGSSAAAFPVAAPTVTIWVNILGSKPTAAADAVAAMAPKFDEPDSRSSLLDLMQQDFCPFLHK